MSINPNPDPDGGYHILKPKPTRKCDICSEEKKHLDNINGVFICLDCQGKMNAQRIQAIRKKHNL